MNKSKMRILTTLFIPIILYLCWCFIEWDIINLSLQSAGDRALYLIFSIFSMIVNYTCPAWWLPKLK